MNLAARLSRLESQPDLKPGRVVAPYPPEAILDTPEIVAAAIALRPYWRRGERPPVELVERLTRLQSEHDAALAARYGVR